MGTEEVQIQRNYFPTSQRPHESILLRGSNFFLPHLSPLLPLIRLFYLIFFYACEWSRRIGGFEFPKLSMITS